MSKEWKIFLGSILLMFFVFEFLNFELAMDSYNISVANQKTKDSLEYKLKILENQCEKRDTVIINNYISLKTTNNKGWN